MRKMYFCLVIIIGALIIGLGIFFQVNDQEKPQPRIEPILFERINAYDQPVVCSNITKEKTYLNMLDNTKVTIDYPNCVHEYNLSYWHKNLKSANEDITLNVYIVKSTVNDYLNKQKELLSKIVNVQFSDKQELISNNEKKYYALEANYQLDKTTYDDIYVAYNIAEKYLLTYEFKVKNGVLDKHIIDSLIDDVIIEENAAKLTSASENNSLLVGSLKQNKLNSYNSGYIIKYQVPNDYTNIPSTNNDLFSTDFYKKTTQGEYHVNIQVMNSINPLNKVINNLYTTSTNHYKKKPLTYQNQKDTEVVEEELAGKKVSYFIFSYDYFNDAQEYAFSESFAYVYYEIAPNFFYTIYIKANHDPITEDVITSFLDIETNEY